VVGPQIADIADTLAPKGRCHHGTHFGFRWAITSVVW